MSCNHSRADKLLIKYRLFPNKVLIVQTGEIINIKRGIKWHKNVSYTCHSIMLCASSLLAFS